MQPTPLKDNGKSEALSQALQQIEKQYGKGSIMRLGGKSHLDITGISTGALSLDVALGGRGVPRGRVVEIFGPESSGKTTLCLHIAANAQRVGGTAAFIDVEHALDPQYARKIGVNIDNLLVSQPDYGEQALEIAECLVRSNAVDVIVVDSVAALVPKAELEGDMGDPQMGLQARLMSQALRKLTATISKCKTCVIFTNQIREKIGVVFGNPETTPGGRALKFYASVRIDIRRLQAIKDSEESTGNRIRCTVVKNKIAPPFRKAEFDIFFASGISFENDLIDLGCTHEVIERSGTWLSYKEHRMGQGRDRAREFLGQNPDIAREIHQAILQKVGLAAPPLAPAAKDGKDEKEADAKPAEVPAARETREPARAAAKK